MYSLKRARRYAVEKISLDVIKPDLLQPRKMYNPKKIYELAASIRQKGIINMPIVEKMNSEKYKRYVMQYPETNIKKELLAQIKNGGTYYLDVVGHRRYVAGLEAGLNMAYVKVTENLSDLERRMIQHHEASQLSFTPWARAKASYNLYLLIKQQKEMEGEKFTRDDFARYMGFGTETVRERFLYVEEVAPKVKGLVEKKETLSYTNAVLIASSIKDHGQQYRNAVVYGKLTKKKTERSSKERGWEKI